MHSEIIKRMSACGEDGWVIMVAVVVVMMVMVAGEIAVT